MQELLGLQFQKKKWLYTDNYRGDIPTHGGSHHGYTLWLFNIAMEKITIFKFGKPSINWPFSIAMWNNQRVSISNPNCTSQTPGLWMVFVSPQRQRPRKGKRALYYEMDLHCAWLGKSAGILCASCWGSFLWVKANIYGGNRQKVKCHWVLTANPFQLTLGHQLWNSASVTVDFDRPPDMGSRIGSSM